MGAADVDRLLASRRRMALNETATVMFTSGSTGRPKGVSFSIYQLIGQAPRSRGGSSRTSGRDEVFLSFLPFYHTFGRYLEMLGAIYWGGTYVFAGSTSVDTLFALLPKVQPDGLHQRPDPLGAALRALPGKRRRGGAGGRSEERVLSGAWSGRASAGACRRPATSIPRSSASSSATASPRRAASA